MSVERIVLAFAGFMIMLTLALGMPGSPIFHHEYWLFFTAFVGLNLFQSAFTLSLIHISEPTRPVGISRMPSSA